MKADELETVLITIILLFLSLLSEMLQPRLNAPAIPASFVDRFVPHVEPLSHDVSSEPFEVPRLFYRTPLDECTSSPGGPCHLLRLFCLQFPGVALQQLK